MGITVPRAYRGFGKGGKGDSYKNNAKTCILKYKKPFLGYKTAYNYGEILIKELRKGKGF